MIDELHIRNYKSYRDFQLPLNPTLNLIVGDNEAGKSTILEAVYLALSCKLNGRSAHHELSPYLFNTAAIAEYLTELKAGRNPELPSIVIEMYLADKDDFARLKGTNNLKKEDRPGIRFEISFDNDFKKEYEALVADASKVRTVPVEYYSIKWLSFSNETISVRNLPVMGSLIDATMIRLQTGTDYYLQAAINDCLTPKEKAGLSVAYRGLKEEFANEAAIASINARLAQYQSVISSRQLAISIDVSQKANWESGLIPYLNDLPFQYIGRGEQSVIKTLFALEKHAEKSQVILLEEPENHLSYSSMAKLVKRIAETCDGKQIILTTHSPYVLNKLGLDNLILLWDSNHTSLSKLPKDTQEYFRKLPGYDTLRLILAKKSILVEGPSDELIVQRAYMDAHEGRLPIEDGIDVMSVRALSFKRFLDIAKELGKVVAVVTDNDGDYKVNVEQKYASYTGDSITICADSDNDYPTLEPQLLKANSREVLNKALGVAFTTDEELLEHMEGNKTDVALKLFESADAINYPEYIQNAVR